MRNFALAGIMGLVVGDALGVPLEFKSRSELRKNPVDSMREYGTYKQPKGTWSDDSTMALCLAESLANGLDYKDICDKFLKWFNDGYMTPHGKMFDIGNATRKAIMRYSKGIDPLDCGGFDDFDNGNGSLMRILPIAFYVMGKPQNERFDIIHNVSRLTHAHITSLIACGIYVEFAISLIKGYAKNKAFIQAKSVCRKVYKENKELAIFNRLFSGDFGKLAESEIKSSGYVVDTLEASIWCLITTESYSECVLKAVNLGEDTDTVAAVAGGLAGILYGYENIPNEWADVIVKKEMIFEICERLDRKQKPFSEVYEFIPYFEQDHTYEWGGGPLPDGTIQFPYPIYDKEMYAFVKAVEVTGFMDFDYGKTLKKYGCSMDNSLSNAIPNANIELTLAILTTYIMQERFYDGLWGRAVKDGIFLSILRRLKTLGELYS